MFREGLRQILEGEPDLEVCGMAGSAEQALPAIERQKPDLVVVDITLPGRSGVDLIRDIRQKKLPVKALVVSMHEEALYADRVLRAGGDGYVMKEEDPTEIVQAIHDVLAGHIYVSEEVLASSAKVLSGNRTRAGGRPLSDLTDAELEILELLGRQQSRRTIARELHLTPQELTERCSQLRRKLKLPTDQALVRAAKDWIQS